MLERIFGKKVCYPAKYGIIERRKPIGGGRYITSEESILLRPSTTIRLGGVFVLDPIYEVRTERVLLNKGDDKGMPSQYKTITRQVVAQKKIRIQFQNLFLPIPFGIEEGPKKRKEPTKNLSITVLRFFLPKEYREQLIGDVLEDFETQKTHLKSWVHIWLVKEVVFSICRVFLAWVAEVVSSFKKTQ